MKCLITRCLCLKKLLSFNMPYFFVMEGKIYDFPTKKPKAQV
jgi:hypothetical protein